MLKRIVSFVLVIVLVTGNVTSSLAAVSSGGTVERENTYTQGEDDGGYGDNAGDDRQETSDTDSENADHETGKEESGDAKGESEGGNTGGTKGEAEGGDTGGSKGETESKSTGEPQSETEDGSTEESKGESEEESTGGSEGETVGGGSGGSGGEHTGETEGGTGNGSTGTIKDKNKPDTGNKSQGVIVTELDIDNAMEFTLRGVKDEDISFDRTRDVLLDIRVNFSGVPVDEIRKAELTLNLPYFEPDEEEFVVAEEETEFGFGAQVISAEGWKYTEVPYNHRGEVVFTKLNVRELADGIVTVRLSPFGYFDYEMIGELSATLHITSGVQDHEIAMTEGIRPHESDGENAGNASEQAVLDDREPSTDEPAGETGTAHQPEETTAAESSVAESSAAETDETKSSEPGTTAGGKPKEEAQETNTGGKPKEEAQETNTGGKPKEEAQETNAGGKPKEEAQETNTGGKPKEEAQETNTGGKPKNESKGTESPKQETGTGEKPETGAEAETPAKAAGIGANLAKLDIPKSRIPMSEEPEPTIPQEKPKEDKESIKNEDSETDSRQTDSTPDEDDDFGEDAEDANGDEHGYKYELYCEVKQELKYQPDAETPMRRARFAVLDEKSLEVHMTFIGDDTSIDKKSQVVATDQEAEILVQLKPNWSEGTADRVRLHIRIPFLKNDGDGKIIIGGPGDSDMKAVLTSVNADGTWYHDDLPEEGFTGEFIIVTDSVKGGTSPSFTMKLRFSGELPENATAQINAYLSYESFDGDGQGWSTPDAMDTNSIVTMVASNLIWTATLKCAQKANQTAIWDRYNYVPFRYSIRNDSEKPEAVVYGFTFNLNLPLSTVLPKRGVFEKDMRMWIYNGEGEEPEYNESGKSAPLYVGNPGKGGIVIYDITDPDNPIGPLPYVYSGSGGVSINIDRGLYPESALSEDRVREGIYSIEIPFPNYFPDLSQKMTLTAQPSVAIGDPGSALSWSKYNQVDYMLVKPADSMTMKKTAPSAKAFFGTLSDYIIGDISNTGNVPVFNADIRDNMEAHFNGRSLSWKVTVPASKGEPSPGEFFFSSQGPEKDVVAAIRLRGLQTGERLLKIEDFVKQEQDNGNGTITFTYTYDVQSALKTRGVYISSFVIYLKERIEPSEKLPGHIVLSGYPRARYEVSNTANLYYTYKSDKSDPVKSGKDPDYNLAQKGPVPSTAKMSVQEPLLAAQSTGENLQIPNGEGKPGVNVEVDYKKRNAYNFYPNTRNAAVVSPGTLEITLPASADGTGFLTDRLYFGKGLVYDDTEPNITSITVKSVSKAEKVFSGKELYDGLLTAEGGGYALDLTAVSSQISHIQGITIGLEIFPGSIQTLNKDYSVKVEGLANRYAQMTASAVWKITYPDGTHSQTSTSATIIGIQPVPALSGSGMRNKGLLLGNPVNVAYKEKNGFRFYPQNYSTNKSIAVGPMRPAVLESTLPVDYVAGAGEPYQGFLLEEIMISSELLKLAPDGADQMILRDKRNSANTVILNKEQLAAYMQDGSIVIPKAAWSDKLEMVGSVRTTFPLFNKTDKDDAGVPNRYIQFYGETNKFGELKATSVWSCPVAIQPAATADAKINVAKPRPVLGSNGVRNKGPVIGSSVNVSIEETNGFRFYPENFVSGTQPGHIGAGNFVGGILEIDLPVYLAGGTSPGANGLLVNEIQITAQLLEQMPEGISSLILQDKAVSSLKVEFTRAELEACLDGNGTIVLTEAMWKAKDSTFGAASKITLNIPKFIETEAGDPQRANRYVALYGHTNRYESLTAQGKWSCGTTGESAKSSATIIAEPPGPALTGRGVRHKGTVVNSSVNVAIEETNGFRFYPENYKPKYNNPANIKANSFIPAILEITLPVYAPEQTNPVYNGLLLNEIHITAELLKLAPQGISSLVLRDKADNSRTVEFTKAELEACLDGDGSILLTEDLWKAKDSDFVLTDKITINFPVFIESGEGSPLRDERYVGLYGHTNRYNSLTAQGIWSCPTAVKKTVNANATIISVPPQPQLSGDGVKQKGPLIGSNVEVAIDETNGYRFYPENYKPSTSPGNLSAGSFIPGLLEISMPVYAPDNANPDYSGVLLQEIYISAELLKLAPQGISSLILYDKANSSRTVTLTKDELEAQIDGDGGILITEDLWKDKEPGFVVAGKIAINFPEFIETQQNHALKKERYVAVYGHTNRYDEQTATSTWSCPKAGTGVKASASATIKVIPPKPGIRVTANYEHLSAARVDVPYGRNGFYQFDFSNESAAPAKKGTATLTLQVAAKSVTQRGIEGRGFFTQQTILSEKLMPFVNEIIFYDAANKNANPKKAEYTLTLVGDELKDSAGKVWWTKGTPGDLVIDIDDPKIPASLTRISEIDVSMASFGGNAAMAATAPEHEYFIRTVGWFNEMPRTQTVESEKWSNTTNNSAAGKWVYEKNTGTYLTVSGTAGVRVTPANIDMAMHARFADDFQGDFAAQSSLYEEWFDINNVNLDIGYKALGSFTVDIEQLKLKGSGGDQYYMYNTPLGITMDVTLPYKDFETYYLRVKDGFLPHIEEIKVYRQNGGGGEDGTPWVTITGDELRANGAVSGGYRRINLLREDNNSGGRLYATRAVAKDAVQDADHPYYRSPGEVMWVPVDRVTRVSIRFKLNQEVKDASGKFLAPSLSDPKTGEILLDFAGRVTSSGTTVSGSTTTIAPFAAVGDMVYDFGLDSPTGGKYPGSKMANEIPKDLLCGTYAKTVRDMLDTYIYQGSYYTLKNYKGTSTTKAFMVTVPANLAVKKDIRSPVRISGTKEKNDHTFGAEESYYVAFYRNNDPSYHTFSWSRNYNGNDWNNRYAAADGFKVIDTLPPVFERQNVSAGDINLYEGILTTEIALEQVLIDIGPQKIVVRMSDGQVQEFTGAGLPPTIRFVYWDGTGTEPAATVYDGATGTFTMKRGVFPVKYEIWFDGFGGHGDFSHDLSGYGLEQIFIKAEGSQEVPPMLKVTGRVYLNDYGNKNVEEAEGRGRNTVGGFVLFDSGEQALYPTTDRARMRAEITYLDAQLDISWRHSLSAQTDTAKHGAGYDYDPTKQVGIHGNYDDPTEFTFEYNLSNPSKANQRKSPIGQFDVSLTGDAGFRPRSMTIPKELFDGVHWELGSLRIVPRGANGQELAAVAIDKANFRYVSETDSYVLNLRSLFGDGSTAGVLGGFIDKNGFMTYDIAWYHMVFKVKAEFWRDPTKYLQDGQELVAGKHDVEINGIYVDLKKTNMDLVNHDFGQDVFNDESTPSIGKVPVDYKKSYQTVNTDPRSTYIAYSNSGYTNPQHNTGVKKAEFSHEVRNMVAKISTGVTRSDIYDDHKRRLKIDNTSIMPGDRMDVKLVVTNTGDPGSVKEGNTYLQDPAIRYTIPQTSGEYVFNMRVAEWELNLAETKAANVNLSLSDSFMYVGENKTALLSSADQKQGQFDITSPDDGRVKDVNFMFHGRLGEGETIVIDLVIEFTDEMKAGTVGPEWYQGRIIGNSGYTALLNMRVSGARTHQYQPLLLGTGAGIVIGTQEIIHKDPYWGAVYGSDTSINNGRFGDLKMVTVDKPELTYSVTDGYNVTDYPLTLHVSQISNLTGHDHTDQAVEVIPDTRNLYGFQLTEWPVPKYPAASEWPAYYSALGNPYPTEAPIVYYKAKPADAGWTEVTDLTSVPPEEIYALRWVYKDLPAYKADGKKDVFALPNVEIKGIGHWRNMKAAGQEQDAAYVLNSNVGQYYDHAAAGTAARGEFPAVAERHHYARLEIGRRKTVTHDIIRQLPLPELDTQAFAAEPTHTYQLADSRRMIAYRPGDTFWYKTTVINHNRYSNTMYGTGPLINPVIFDKLPEYITGRGLEQGDGLRYRVYGSDGSPISEERRQQINVTIDKVVTGDRRPDTFGATDVQYTFNSGKYPLRGMTYKNPQTIAFDVYEIRFNGLDLNRGERLELWYEATVRQENLPMWYTDISGRRGNAYLPRIGEYYYYYASRYGYLHSPMIADVPNQFMTGDFLLHDVGLSADLNPNAMEKELLANYKTVMPENETGSSENTYTELRPDSVVVHDVRGSTSKPDNFDISQSSIWNIEVKSRVLPYRWLNDKNIRENGGTGQAGVNRNTIWTQNKLHLKKAWLYGASQMISADKQYIRESSADPYKSGAYYTNAVQELDIYTSRLRAVNYGDHLLDGTTFIYVLPRGTEPAFEEDGTLRLTGYYGSTKDPVTSDSNVGLNVALAGDEEIEYEILQSPDQPAEKGTYPATAKWMEPITGAGPADVFKTELNNQPWILKVTVKAPLAPMWKRVGQAIPGSGITAYNGVDRSQMFVEFATRVVQPNGDGRWYDELYTTAWDDGTKAVPNSLYMQIMTNDFGRYMSGAGGLLSSRTTPLNDLFIRGRFHGVRKTDAADTRTRLSALADSDTQIDTDFNGSAEELMYSHTGDMMRNRHAVMRVWADVGETTQNSPIGAYKGGRATAEFYRETAEVFDLNIHVNNNYLGSQNTPESGMKGSLFDPVITNILPYGLVPMDTNGTAMPLDGSGFGQNVDYQIKMTGVDAGEFKRLWDVSVGFLEDSPTGCGRYQVVWIPKSVEAERVILDYGNTIDIELKVMTISLPETAAYSGGNPKEDAQLFEQWQKNRTYVASKSDIAFLSMETGANLTGSATDDKRSGEDKQSKNGFIKAQVLGTQAMTYEDNRYELEDYVSAKGRPSWQLKPDNLGTDFNRNGKINHVTGDEDAVKTPVISNTLTIYSRVPRVTTSLTMQTNNQVNIAAPLSYGSEIWYSVKTQNEPVSPSRGSELPDLMKNEKTKGMVKQSWMDYYLWLPGNAGYDQYYEIVYPNGTTLNPEALKAAGWLVEVVADQTAEYAAEARLLHIRVAPSGDFNPDNRQYRMPKQTGDLATGEWFTLRVRTRALGAHKPLPTNDPWGPYAANIYVKTQQLADTNDYQPQGLVQYSVEVMEESGKTKDINGDGIWGDRYSATNGSFSMKKPAGAIRNDTVRTRSKFGETGATDYPVYKASDAVEFIIDDAVLRNTNTASVPELIIFSNALSMKEYAVDKARTGWKSYISTVSTGVWSMPAPYNINDYVMDVYYTEETGVAFGDFGDRSQWKLVAEGVSLTENRTLVIPGGSAAERAVFVIGHKDPALRDRNLVPVGTRLDITPDINTIDPTRGHLMEYPDYVHKNSMLVNFSASVEDEQQRFIYNNCSIWARYNKHQYVELGRSYNGGFITPAYPVADIQIRGKYFRREPGIDPIFNWNTNMVVQLGNSPTLRYQITYGPVDQQQLDENSPGGVSQKTEDSMADPQVVVALQDILHVDPLYFAEEKNPAGTPLDEAYSSTQRLDLIDKNRDLPKWTWELIQDPDNIDKGKYSHISNVKAEIAYSEPLGRQTIVWSTEGILFPGDYLKFTFIVDISRYDSTTKEQVVGYGYNLNGTMMAYDEENHQAGKTRAGRVALFADIKDYNNNKSFVERYVTTTVEPTFSFASQYDFPKNKTVLTDLEVEPRAGEPPAAMTEGSIYHFANKISNTNNIGVNDFRNPVIFDILPHVDDTQVSGRQEQPGTGIYTAIKRGTKWSGWLLPETVKLCIRPDVDQEPQPADPALYQLWVGPVKLDNGRLAPGDPADLPELATRSQDAFYDEMRTGKADDIAAKYGLVPMRDVLALKDSEPQLYQQIAKNLMGIFMQMEDPSFMMTGRMDLILEYDMRGPLNLPKYDGTSEEGRGWVPYSSWNSYASKTNEMRLGESRFAGVYLNNPAGRAYIGDYVWWDVNYDGVMNEARLGPDVNGNGRDLPQQWLTEHGDVGINGVVVELLTADGYPSDKEGNRILTRMEQGLECYYVLDENGDIETILDVPVMGTKPVTYTTTSDYKGRQGYYILTNLSPGNYRLKYTFPEQYKHFGLTTLTTHSGAVAVKGYRAGEVPADVPGQNAAAASLSAITAAFEVEAGLEDSKYVDYDLGVALPYRLGGKSWFDFNSDPDKNRNGIFDAGEQLLSGTKVTVYLEDGSTAMDMHGKPMQTVTDGNGEFVLNCIMPGRGYYIVSEDNDQIAEAIPSPVRPDDNPLHAKNHNDLYLLIDTGDPVDRTNVFTPTLTGVGTETFDNAIRHVLQDPIGLAYTKPKGGMLIGSIWSDANRDGIWDDSEQTLGDTNVTLERYLNQNGSWVKDEAFTVMTMVTNSSGSYLFDELDRTYKQDGQNVAYGYRVAVKREDMPDGHSISPYTGDQQQYRRNDMGGDGYMPAQHVIFADKITGNDMVLKTVVSGVDAGFAPFAPGYISGVAWNDKNKDGVRQDDERLLSLETLTLTVLDGTAYQPVKRLEGRYVLPGQTDYNHPDAQPVIAVTDDYGAYQFSGLPPGHPVTKAPCYYRVEYTRNEFDEYTGYQQGADTDRNNDFKPETTDARLGFTQYLMLTKEVPGSLFGYDYMVSMGHEHIDLGLVCAGVIGDYAWLDANGNGLQDAEDEVLFGQTPGIDGVLVELMTDDGYKSDGGGRRLVRVGNEYYVADKNGAATGRRGEPKEAVTRTYRGEAGYYLITGISYQPEANLRLRYTFPDECRKLTGTTTAVYGGTTGVTWTPPGLDYQIGTQSVQAQALTAVTETFRLTPDSGIDPETGFDVGVTLPVRIGGIVWIDENFEIPANEANGYYDQGEVLAENALVTLYEPDGTPAKDWFGNPMQTRTDADGSYLFEAVKPGQYYAVAQLPEEYRNYIPTIKVTNDVFAHDHDNDASRRRGICRTEVWTADLPLDGNGVLMLGADPILMAMAERSIGFGYATTPKGEIAGRFWIDLDWNGLQDAGEPAATALEGETVYIRRYRRFSWSDAWELDPYFITRNATLNANAEYRFAGLTGYDFADNEDDDIYIYGYEVWTRNAPSGYAVTIHQDTPAERNSDLDHDGYLSRMNRLTELAIKDVTGNYSLVSVRSENSLDGGFAAYKSVALKGIVWDDENRDGMIAGGEDVLPGTRVALEVYDKKSGGYLPVQNTGGTVILPDHTDYTGDGWSVAAAADGSYEFTGLPVASDMKDVVYRYQVVTEKERDMLWTAVDHSGGLDNKLKEEQDRIPWSASIGVAFAEPDSKLTPFPLRESEQGVISIDDHHLGMLSAPIRVISGIVWNDGNKDGWLEDSEGRRSGREVTLYRYNPEADTYEPTADLTGASMKLTDGTGYYEFRVPIADLDPDSPQYLNPYRYRTVAKKLYTERFSPAEIGEEAELHNKGVKLRKYGYEAGILEDYVVNGTRLIFGEAVEIDSEIAAIVTAGYGNRNHIHFGICDYTPPDRGKPEPETKPKPEPTPEPIPEVPPHPGFPDAHGSDGGDGLDLDNIDPNGMPAGWMENMDPNGVPRTADSGPDIKKLLIVLMLSGSLLFVVARKRKREADQE